MPIKDVPQPEYVPADNLYQEYRQGETRLKELKGNIRLLVADYDGTIYDRHDPVFDHRRAMELCAQVLSNKIHVCIATARDATLAYELYQILPVIAKEMDANFTLYRGGGNGLNLKRERAKPDGTIESELIYAYHINPDHIEAAISAYQALDVVSPDISSQEFFQKHLQHSWGNIISEEYVGLANEFNGRVFIEPIKISFVLPSEKTEQAKCVTVLRQQLEPIGLSVGWGNMPFADISRQIIIEGKIVDGKQYMAQTLASLLDVEENQTACFGDAPSGNDAGLLSFPYSFTNNARDVVKPYLEHPPYILRPTVQSASPVDTVHKAISFLLS